MIVVKFRIQIHIHVFIFNVWMDENADNDDDVNAIITSSEAAPCRMMGAVPPAATAAAAAAAAAPTAATAATAANKSRPTDYSSEIENLCRDPMSLAVFKR